MIDSLSIIGNIFVYNSKCRAIDRFFDTESLGLAKKESSSGPAASKVCIERRVGRTGKKRLHRADGTYDDCESPEGLGSQSCFNPSTKKSPITCFHPSNDTFYQ